MQNAGLCSWVGGYGHAYIRLTNFHAHLTFSEAKKAPIVRVNLQKALEGLEMEMSTVRHLLKHFSPPLADICVLIVTVCTYMDVIISSLSKEWAPRPR